MKCDNCSQDYTPGPLRDFGTDALGLHYCDACKLPWAENVMHEADGVITPDGIERVGDAVARVRAARQTQDWTLAHALTQTTFETVNHLRFALDIRPELRRDRKLQASKKRPRRPRAPELDWHLENSLGVNPHATNDELWASIPDDRDDFARDGIYRDGDKVVVYHDDHEHAITRRSFERHATMARKRRAVSN